MQRRPEHKECVIETKRVAPLGETHSHKGKDISTRTMGVPRALVTDGKEVVKNHLHAKFI